MFRMTLLALSQQRFYSSLWEGRPEMDHTHLWSLVLSPLGGVWLEYIAAAEDSMLAGLPGPNATLKTMMQLISEEEVRIRCLLQ